MKHLLEKIGIPQFVKECLTLHGTPKIITFSQRRVISFHPEEYESSTRHPLVFLRYILLLSSLQRTPLSFVHPLIWETNFYTNTKEEGKLYFIML